MRSRTPDREDEVSTLAPRGISGGRTVDCRAPRQVVEAGRDAGVHRDIFTAVHDTSIKCCSDCTASYTLLELCKLRQGESFEPLLTRRDG